MFQGWCTQRFKPTIRSGRTQRGVSLLLALLFVAFFGAVLVTIARFNSDTIRVSEARVAGWEAIEIAKAARLYMRDQLIANPTTLRNTYATPQSISIATLSNGGYLSRGFGRTGSTSALNQPIYVVGANWPLNGDPNDNATVPTAFVILGTSAKSQPEFMVQAVDNARKLGATINAPLFDSSGANISADCRGGGNSVGLWDTGCLTPAEYATLAAAVGAPTVFQAGGLVIPVWKAVQPDMRAVMRVPQPENGGYATMLTDLQMGSPNGDCSLATNQVSIKTVDNSDPLNPVIKDVSTGVCKVVDDDAATNNRFSINEVGNMTAERLVAEGQFADYGAEASDIGTSRDDVMRISGNVTLGADMRVFNTMPMPVAQGGQQAVNARFDIPQGTLAVERNAYVYSQDTSHHATATIGSIQEARALISDSLEATRFESYQPGLSQVPTAQEPTPKAHMNVTNTIDINGNVAATGGANSEMIAKELNAPGATFSASNTTGQVQISDTLDLQGSTMQVNGAAQAATGDYAAISGAITNTNKITVNDDLNPSAVDINFGGSIQSNSVRSYTTTTMPSISTTACLESASVAGGCPDRQYVPPNITP